MTNMSAEYFTSELAAKYEKQVKYLSILHEATVRQLVYR